jgi:hypothetical protein
MKLNSAASFPPPARRSQPLTTDAAVISGKVGTKCCGERNI